MPDAATLIKDAADYTKELLEVAKKADAQTQAVQKAVNASPASVKGIQDATTAAGKPLVGWDKTYAEAEKLLPAVQKIKVPQAQAAAKSLSDAMSKADKSLTGLHGNIDMADKIADKSGKEDAELGKKLDAAIKGGRDVEGKLGSSIIMIPGQFEQVDVNLKKAPGAAQFGKQAKMTLTQAKENVKEMGSQITTADSYATSLKTLGAKAKEAYLPDVRAQAKEAEELEKSLTEKIKAGKKLLNESLNDIKKDEGQLKTLGIA